MQSVKRKLCEAEDAEDDERIEKLTLQLQDLERREQVCMRLIISLACNHKQHAYVPHFSLCDKQVFSAAHCIAVDGAMFTSEHPLS